MCSFGGFPHDKFVKSLLAQVGSLVISLKAPWACTTLTKGNMKVINYKNKKLKLPYDLAAGETSTEMVTRQNPFSGESIQLPEFAAVIYDKTIELNLAAERKDSATGQALGFSDNQDDWQLVRNGINFFRQYFAKEYMVLLD